MFVLKTHFFQRRYWAFNSKHAGEVIYNRYTFVYIRTGCGYDNHTGVIEIRQDFEMFILC